MQSPILGGSYTSRSRNLAYEQCINLMPLMIDKPQGKAVGMLINTPGLDLLATIGAGPIRGGTSYGIYAYVVSGNALYQVNRSWQATLLGNLATSSGPVSVLANTTQLLVSDGQLGYLVTYGPPATFATVTSFPVGAQILAYQDGFGLTNIAGTNQWFQSNLNDFSMWGGLNFSSADAQPENIVSIVDCNNQVWLLSVDHMELWVNAGLAGFAFQRLAGVQPEVGCVAPYSAIQVGDSVMWLSQDNKGQGLVMRTKGYGTEDVTDEPTAYQFAQYAKTYGIADAIAFTYQQEKHAFYWLIFPAAGASWVFDLTTGKWHQRCYWNNGNFYRHLANCGFFFNNANVVGDYSSGNIYALDLDTYTDNGQPKRWVRSWRALPPTKAAFQPMTFDSLQIDAQTGISVPASSAPEVMLRWSDDGGHRWSNEVKCAFGNTGQTSLRVKFRRLGSTRADQGLDRIFELSGTDPVPIALLGAELEASPA